MHRNLFRRVALLAPWIVSLAAPLAHAAAGDLDPAFGQGGISILSFASAPTFAGDSRLQPDGRLVFIAGFDDTPAATEAFGLIRVLSNGQLDASFGRSGVAMTAFTNFINMPSAMALLPDGKIVVVGNATSADGTLSEFAIARFTARGVLDRSFGQQGKVVTNFVGVKAGGVSNPATAVLAVPGGGLLVAGVASQCGDCPHLTALARYDADGNLDASFGTGGMVAVAAIEAPSALALLSNGDILALAGDELAEFTPDGGLTTVVSTTNGAAITGLASTGPSMFATNGQFLAALGAQGPFGPHDIDIQVKRFNPLSNVDVPFTSPIFDFVGVATAPTSESAQAIAIAANGQIVVGGISAPASGQSDFGLARLNDDGTLDASFGNHGVVTTILSGPRGPLTSFVSTLLTQPDGKIVAIGLAENHNAKTFLALVRYLGE